MQKVLYTKSNKEQRRSLLRLLSEAFGHQYLHYYELHLDTLATPQSTLLLGESDEEILAHIQLVPYFAKIHPAAAPLNCAYLYAVCTAKSHQGRGIMSEWIDSLLRTELAALGYHQAILVPADLGLIDYYKKLDFTTMKGGIYLKAPRDYYPAIRPSEVAEDYIECAYELDAQFSELPAPQKTLQKWHPFMPKQVGWMSFALSGEPLPRETILINPLV